MADKNDDNKDSLDPMDVERGTISVSTGWTEEQLAQFAYENKIKGLLAGWAFGGMLTGLGTSIAGIAGIALAWVGIGVGLLFMLILLIFVALSKKKKKKKQKKMPNGIDESDNPTHPAGSQI